MAKKPLLISSFNILEFSLYILVLVTILSLTLNSSFSFQPLCVIRLARQALPGHVYTAFRRQICTCSPYAAGWLGESQTETPHCVHLDSTSQRLNGWALLRAPGWSHASWLPQSSALSGSQRGRSKSLCAFKTPRAHGLGCCSERVPDPLCVLLHSLADLTSSLLSRARHQATQVPHLYCLSVCWDASRMTTVTAFVIFLLWAPQG